MPNPGKNRKNQLQARTDRRRQVADLYLRGQSQVEIADRLECSQPTVSNDLAALREQWLASSLRDFDAAKAEELAKLDHLEAEAWSAWERSCRDAETRHVRVERIPVVTRKRGKMRVGPETRRLEVVRRLSERTVKKQVGDARFLDQVARCIELRLKVLIDLRIGEVEDRLAGLEGAAHNGRPSLNGRART